MAKERKPVHKVVMTEGKRIVSRIFRKFNFCRLVSGSQPAILSGSVSDSM